MDRADLGVCDLIVGRTAADCKHAETMITEVLRKFGAYVSCAMSSKLYRVDLILAFSLPASSD